MLEVSRLILLCSLSITASYSLEDERYFIKANLWEKNLVSGKQNSTAEFLQISCGIYTCTNMACCGSGLIRGCCGESYNDICCNSGTSCCPRRYGTCCGDFCCNPSLAYCSNGMECLKHPPPTESPSDGTSTSSMVTSRVIILTTTASLAILAGIIFGL